MLFNFAVFSLNSTYYPTIKRLGLVFAPNTATLFETRALLAFVVQALSTVTPLLPALRIQYRHDLEWCTTNKATSKLPPR